MPPDPARKGVEEMEWRAGTEQQRRRFLAALGLFLLWVAALGVMAYTTGRKPAARAPSAEGR
jgi:hypothetical protein